MWHSAFSISSADHDDVILDQHPCSASCTALGNRRAVWSSPGPGQVLAGAVRIIPYPRVYNDSSLKGGAALRPLCRWPACGVLRGPAGSCGVLRGPAGSCGGLRDLRDPDSPNQSELTLKSCISAPLLYNLIVRPSVRPPVRPCVRHLSSGWSWGRGRSWSWSWSWKWKTIRLASCPKEQRPNR